MPTKSYTIANFSLNSYWKVGYDGHDYTWINTPSLDTQIKSIDITGIETGSTINSAILTATMGSVSTGSDTNTTAFSTNNSLFSTNTGWDDTVNPYTEPIPVSYIVVSGKLYIKFRFKANGSLTAGSGDKQASLALSDISVSIDYTLPYTNATAPTSVTVSPTSTGKEKEATLSWSGAGGGTNNNITGYQIWRGESAASGYATLGAKIDSSATSLTAKVYSHATNGSKYYYKVSTYGTQAGYDSGQSTSYATLTTTWTDPTPPNSVTGPNNVVPGSIQSIIWSGASNGTNTPISGYALYSNTDSYTTPIATTAANVLNANVTAHGTSGSSITYKVKVLTALGGVMSTASHTMTSLRGVVTAPTSVSFSKTNVAPSEPVSLSWSGESGGANNAIQKFEIETSTDGTNYSKLGEKLQSPYSPITASASNGGKIYARVKVIGEVGSATSSAASVTTKVTKPNPPSSISINDNFDVLYSATRTLTWSGAAGGTNNDIKGYRIMLSVDGATATQLGTDILTTATGLTTQVTAKSSNGYHEYSIHTIGATTITAEQLSLVSGKARLTTTVTNPTAPTTVTVPTNVAPGSTQSISWSGAENGKNNPITTFDIYEKSGSGSWAKLTSDGTSPYSALTAHTDNGGTKSYYIVAVGTSGRGDSPASAIKVMTTTVSKPGAPATLSIADNTNAPPNVDRTLTWSGASVGTYNNTIKGYRVMLSTDGGVSYTQYGSDQTTSSTSSSMTVKTRNGNGAHSYKVITLGNTLGINSDQSSATATLTTAVTAPSAPTTVSVANGSAVPPLAVRALSWSGAKKGTNNDIKGYQIRQSSDNATYANLGSAILTPDVESGTLSVTAPSGDGTYYYKVITLGETLSMNSGESATPATLSTQKTKSTASLNKSTVTATGSESITATITQQDGMSYTHKVTWYISGNYTSGVLDLAAGTLTSAYTVPQSWIAATTKTTASVTAKCKVETFDGANSLGYNEYSFVVNVPGKSTIALGKLLVDITGASPGDNTVTISTKYSGYKHSVNWFASATYQVTRTVAPAASPTDTYTFPVEWNNVAPNASSFTITCTVETIKVTSDGDLSLGTNYLTFQGNVPTSIVPVVNSITPSQVTPYWGLYVKGKSKCKLTPVATGAYSSSVVSYEITWPTNQTSGVLVYSAGTSWTTGTLSAAGSITYTVKVTDSRGRTATKAATAITVTDYAPPSITAASVTRSDSGGTPDYVSGTYIKALATMVYSAIGSNAITAKVYYQESGTATWLPANGTEVAIPAGGVTSTVYGGGAIDMAKTYQTKITLTDAFTTVEHLGQISTVIRVFDVREDRAGFGRIASTAKELAVPSDWDFVKGLTKVSYVGHTHTTSNITDFPTSMPASDVSAWAKAATKPAYAWSEITSKPTTFDPTAHTHVKANIADFPASMPASDVSAWAKAATKPAYAWTEITSRPATFAPSTHTHLWADLTDKPATFAPSAHTHTKANITDFPTTMPASDVYAWAKAATKPAYTNTEVGAAATSHSHGYLPLAGGTVTGKVDVPTASRSAGVYGSYDSYKTGHVWSMGTAYAILDDGSTFGTLYGIAYKHTNNLTGGTMAGGHQIVFCSAGTPGAAIGMAGNIWTSGTIYEGGTALNTRYAATSHTHAYAPVTHTHTKAQITDMPTTLPASDVYAWAKAAAKPAYTYTEVGAAATSHSHGYLPTAGGTLTGAVYARYGVNYTTLELRNISFAATTLPATTTAQNGAVCVLY